MEICEALAELKSEIVGMYMKQVGFLVDLSQLIIILWLHVAVHLTPSPFYYRLNPQRWKLTVNGEW